MSFLFTDAEDYSGFQLVSITFDEGAAFGDELCHLVAITDDTVLEDEEQFFVTLTSNEPAYFGSGLTQATVTIKCDPADCKDIDYPK